MNHGALLATTRMGHTFQKAPSTDRLVVDPEAAAVITFDVIIDLPLCLLPCISCSNLRSLHYTMATCHCCQIAPSA